jgi:cytochrome P450
MTVAWDPHEYDEPKRFLPERFMNEDLNKPLAGHWSFGMGRRGTLTACYCSLSLRRLRICCEKPLDCHGQDDLLFRC